MVNVIGTAVDLGYIEDPLGTLVEFEEIKDYPPDKVVLITTGSQGESMAALSRMAANIHKKIKLMAGDVIVFSSHPIPGNEKAVSNVINELAEIGAEVLFQDTHVSGHACKEEIKLIYSLIHPKYAVPVHGERRHLLAQAQIAESLGIPKDRIWLLHTGDVLELDGNGAEIIGKVQAGGILVDGLGVGDVGNIVIRDRQRLSEDGIIIVVMTLSKGNCELLAGPDLVTRGFVYVRESEDLIEEAERTVGEAVEYCLTHGTTDWSAIKSAIKDELSDFVWARTQRRPMILPIIMEASV